MFGFLSSFPCSSLYKYLLPMLLKVTPFAASLAALFASSVILLPCALVSLSIKSDTPKKLLLTIDY